MSNWTTISNSSFSHEEEALQFLRGVLPPDSRFVGWSNFEFVADEGSIYEVDALVVGPWGAFLVEIKSRPGTVTGGGNSWCWNQDGRRKSADNPVLLTNRKAKALASILNRQKAFSKLRTPFIEPLIFLSDPSNTIGLKHRDAFHVANRDTIEAAIRRRDCPGLKQFSSPPISGPQLRAFHQAMEQAGLRPLNATRRAGDHVLEELFLDSPTGSFQDWTGKHRSVQSGRKLIRLYAAERQASQEEREVLNRAAEREYQIMLLLDHPGILRVETLTSWDHGSALVYRFEDGARRLDHFLDEHQDAMGLDERMDFLRQIAEALAYAHRKRVIHRALSPQSILVFPDKETESGWRLKIYGWQVGVLRGDSQASQVSRLSKTIHAGQLIEDEATVYLAPELISGHSFDGEALDGFSLGALAYRIFSGQSPARTILELDRKLADNQGALDLRAAYGAAPDCLVDLVRFSANAQHDVRYTADDFIKELDRAYDTLTAPDPQAYADPRSAKVKDLLAHEFTVLANLGSGGISKVHLVQPEDKKASPLVLKVASKAEHNRRIEQEFAVLRELKHPGIVKAEGLYDFGEVKGFTMARAGNQTLAQRIRNEGKLEVEFLERFGKELLQTVDYLDQNGIPHRDIKPENLGVGSVGKGPVRLILFDFSLSRSPLDQIAVGTPPYLDPFLPQRASKRWDSYAERYAAAMTLYEMSTGVHVTYGDGHTKVEFTTGEANIDPDLFPSQLRDALSAFFERAFKRDYRERHDNAESMLLEWIAIFRDVDKPTVAATSSIHDDEAQDFEAILATTTPETQLILLGLSTRLANTLDRLGIVTVEELLKYPLIRIHRMRGVGKKTRDEVVSLVHKLRQRFPQVKRKDSEVASALSEEEDTSGPEAVSIDLTVKQLLSLNARRKDSRDQQILRGFLGFNADDADAGAPAWPSQSDFAKTVDITRARIGQIVTSARDKWLKVPALTSVREAVANLLREQGGVMSHEELIESILSIRGSALEGAERTRMGSVVVRAAVEAERQLESPRFADFRRQDRIFVAVDAAFVDYALKLGDRADELARAEAVPSAERTVDALREIPFPDNQDLLQPGAERLVRLAARASSLAAASPRMEIYPRGMAAERALRLARGSLVINRASSGPDRLTVAQIHARVAAAFPAAEPLPDRPELDALLEAIQFPLQWSAKVAGYVPPARPDSTLTTGYSSLTRYATRHSSSRLPEIDSDKAEAERLQKKLDYACKAGAYQILAVEGRFLDRARDELCRKFPLTLIDGDELFLDSMRRQAESLRVNWEVVLAADAADPDSRDWERLQRLIDRAMPELEKAFHRPDEVLLLTSAGLFVRYRKLDLLNRIRDRVGTTEGPKGLWILIPGGGKDFPHINGTSLPMTNQAQFEKLSEAWLKNALPSPSSGKTA